MTRLLGLDALRGGAALLVLWFHLHHSHQIGFFPTRGYLAVDFFFMLSGYVMARTYEGRLRGGLWFMKKRIVRLWPTVALGSLLGLAVMQQSSFSAFAIVAALNLVMLPVLWTGGAAFPLNTPMWSIFFELIANVLHGFGLHRVDTRKLAIIVAAAGVVGLAMAVRNGSYSMGSNADDFLGGVPRVIFAYFLGVILWRTWKDKPAFRISPLWLLPAAAFLLTPREPWTDFLFVAAACPLIIAIGVTAQPGRWATGVGDLSFPLYAVHRPALGLATLAGVGPMLGAAGAIFAAIVILLLVRWRNILDQLRTKAAEGAAKVSA